MDSWLVRLKKFLFVIVITIALSNCHEKPEKVGIDHLNWGQDEINFCDAYPFEWDSILIILPYTRFSVLKSKLRLRNISPISEELKDMQYIDWKRYLLFIRGNRNVVAYAPMSSQYNFNFDLYKKPGFKFISHSNCIMNLKKDTSEHAKKKMPFFIIEVESE